MKFLATAFVLLAAVAMLVQASPMLGPPGRHGDILPFLPIETDVLPHAKDVLPLVEGVLPHAKDVLPLVEDVLPIDSDVSPPLEKFLQDHTTAVKKLNGTIKALKKGLEKHEKKIFETSINDIYGAAYNVEKVAKEFMDKLNRDYKVEPRYQIQPID